MYNLQFTGSDYTGNNKVDRYCVVGDESQSVLFHGSLNECLDFQKIMYMAKSLRKQPRNENEMEMTE